MLWLVIILMTTLLFVIGYLIIMKKDIASFHKQLAYAKKEESLFPLFLQSTDPALKELVQQINELKKDELHLKGEYRQRDRMQKEMIANISHDIRTPLTSIQGYLEMYAASDDEKERKTYYSIITRRLDSLKNMLEELFLYSRLLQEEFQYPLKRTALYPVVCGCFLSFYEEFHTVQMEPLIKFDDEGIYVDSNAEALHRIFQNLIMNALQHGNRNIQCFVSKDKEGCCILFQNSLVQGSVPDVTKLFDRYYKEEKKERQPYSSSGLGLAIVKNLTEKICGTIEARIEDQKLIFELHIPMADQTDITK